MNETKMRKRNKEDKTLGLTLVVLSLIMLFSLLLFPYKVNPIFLVELMLMSVVGYSGILIFLLLSIILTTHYYLGVTLSWFSKKRIVWLMILLYSTLMIMSIVAFTGTTITYNHFKIAGFVDYYNAVAVNTFTNVFASGQWLERISFRSQLSINGFIIPVLLWILGGFWIKGIITIILLVLVVLYAAYVLITNEHTILLSNLAFWVNDSKSIVTQKSFGVDLNQSTEEFELNFSGKKEITQEKIELVERVRSTMDKKSYEELSSKIAIEKSKLVDLRQKVIDKIKASKDVYKKESRITEDQRRDIMGTLGQSTYSSILANSNSQMPVVEKQTTTIEYTKPESYVEEDKIDENIELLNEGYKTTEQVINLQEPSLNDIFIEDMLDGFDPTMEVPLLETYKEIFEDEKIVKEVEKTLETIIQLESQLEEKESTAEVIIEGLDESVTVEEYLSIPDIIQEAKVIDEQIHDHTEDGEFTSIDDSKVDDSKTSEAAIKFLEEIIDNYDLTSEVEEPEYKSVPTEQIKVEEEPVAFEFLEQEEEVEEEVKQEGRPENWCQGYVLPSTSILSSSSSSFDNNILIEEANKKAHLLNTTFSSFGVKANVHSFELGPTITTFKVTLEPGIKTTKVTNLEEDIKLALGAEYIRILAPIPGTSFMGIEIPNSKKRPVLFKTVYDETNEQSEGAIMISIGQGVSGKSLSFDLAKAPHLLVAGSTGSGKSVAINTILASILLRYKPTDVQLVLIDPKMVEFAPFHGVPHLLAEVITDAQNANNALKAMVDEMEDRYRLMASMGVKKLEELNSKLLEQGKEKLPYVVIVIDELADLMMIAAKEVEDSIMRITQKARAAGIHMVLATQRPSTEIITGTIKSNIPSRMAFTVASSIDSRTILGQVGAEKLIGMGDMLVSLYGQLPFRGQGAYISNEEVDDIASFVKSQCSASYKIDVNSLIELGNPMNQGLVSIDDPMYIAAKDIVLQYGKASTSMLQRQLGIGYNKAANLIDTLEEQGIIGPANGSKPREVLR